MHLVVVCPRCKGAMAVREEQKSATCPRCERGFAPRRSRAYHRTEDPTELARLVGEMNARLEGGFQRYEADSRASEAVRSKRRPGDLETIAGRVGLVRGRVKQLDKALSLLCGRDGGTFSSDEILGVLEGAGWDHPAAEGVLERLLEDGRVLESRPDVYRMA